MTFMVLALCIFGGCAVAYVIGAVHGREQEAARWLRALAAVGREGAGSAERGARSREQEGGADGQRPPVPFPLPASCCPLLPACSPGEAVAWTDASGVVHHVIVGRN